MLMYDEYGFGPDGKHRDTGMLTDKKGFKQDGTYVYTGEFFDSNGFDRDGYDKDGRDKYGYNIHGYDRFGNRDTGVQGNKQGDDGGLQELPPDHFIRSKQR